MAFFLWRKNKSDQLIKSSVEADFGEIVIFIDSMIAKTPVDESYNTMPIVLRGHLQIFWLLHICVALSVTEIVHLCSEVFGVNLTIPQIKNMLYCMKIARWTEIFEYSNISYWYSVVDADPFVKYRYLSGVVETDTFIRRSEAAKEILGILGHPRQVLRHIRKAKEAANGPA